MSKKKNSFREMIKANLLSGSTFAAEPESVRLFNHYKNLALNLYRWENLPKGLESRHIEKFLFEHGQAFFYNDEEFGLMCLPSSTSGRINVYGDPTRVFVNGANGYQKTLDIEDGIRILNNDSMLPTSYHIAHYADRMQQVDELIQQNLRQQRFPLIMATTKQNEFSVKNLIKKIFSGEEAIFYDKTLTEEGRLGVQAIQTNVPYLVDKLQQYRNELEKELLTFLGLNSTINKKERLLVDETNANNSFIEMSLDLGFKQRQKACEMINEKFGLNIKVSKTLDLLEPTMLQTSNPNMVDKAKGGLENV